MFPLAAVVACAKVEMKCDTLVRVGQLAGDDIDPRLGDAGGGRV
jgi:hypothetical protein